MRKKFMVTVLVCAMLGLLVGCAGKTDDSKTDGQEQTKTSDSKSGEDDKIVIGWSVPTAQEDVWVKQAESFERIAKEAGCEVITQQANLDVNTQISQIENLVTQQVDVIVVGPVDNSSLGPVLTQANDAGIPVLAFVRQINDCPISAMLTYDFVSIGEAGSQYATEKCPKGNYVIIGGDMAQAPDTTDLDEGMLKCVQPLVDKGDINIVLQQNVNGWKAETALAMVENALSMMDNDIQAVLCANDGMAYGVVQALEDAGLAGKVVVTGHDGELAALKLIAQGKMSETAFKGVDLFCTQAVDIAVKLANGEELEPDFTFNNGNMDVPSFRGEFLTVTTENIEELIVDGGYYTREEIFGE